jgi:hypothetical protein
VERGRFGTWVLPADAAVVLLKETRQQSAMHSKRLPPYHVELSADVIATGTIGGPLQKDRQRALALTLDRVLFGKVDQKQVSTPDQLPSFGCMPPSEPQSPSKFYPPGTRVLVFLVAQPESGFRLLRMQPLEGGRVDPWLVRFAELRAASSKTDAEAEYRRLLVNESWEAGSAASLVLAGGEYGGWHISVATDPRLTPVLLEQLERCGPEGARGPWRDAAEKLSRILLVLPLAERHRGVNPVLDCLRSLPADTGRAADGRPLDPVDGRSPLDEALESSIQNADPKELARLRAYEAQRAQAGILVLIGEYGREGDAGLQIAQQRRAIRLYRRFIERVRTHSNAAAAIEENRKRIADAEQAIAFLAASGAGAARK